jgi:hypothetical protein
MSKLIQYKCPISHNTTNIKLTKQKGTKPKNRKINNPTNKLKKIKSKAPPKIGLGLPASPKINKIKRKKKKYPKKTL